MATDEKLDARQQIAKQLDKLLNKPTSDVTVGGFKMDYGVSSNFKKANLSDAEIDKYITRKKRGMLAEEIKGADDPLGYVQGLKRSDIMGELPGGVTRQQAERLAKMTKASRALTKASRAGEQVAARAQTPYKRPELEPKIPEPMPRESDRLSPDEMKAAGFKGLGELKQMQDDRKNERGFTGLGKGTPLTTPGQKMRRAARLAERKGNIGRANQLFEQAREIDPEATAFFKSPMEREAAKSAQQKAIVGLARKRAEEAR